MSQYAGQGWQHLFMAVLFLVRSVQEFGYDLALHYIKSHYYPEIWDAFSDLGSLVGSPAMKQPVACNGSAGADNLIADLCIHVVWEPQTKGLLTSESLFMAVMYQVEESRDS